MDEWLFYFFCITFCLVTNVFQTLDKYISQATRDGAVSVGAESIRTLEIWMDGKQKPAFQRKFGARNGC